MLLQKKANCVSAGIKNNVVCKAKHFPDQILPRKSKQASRICGKPKESKENGALTGILHLTYKHSFRKEKRQKISYMLKCYKQEKPSPQTPWKGQVTGLNKIFSQLHLLKWPMQQVGTLYLSVTCHIGPTGEGQDNTQWTPDLPSWSCLMVVRFWERRVWLCEP